MHTTPSLFISHGSPMIALEPREAGAALQRLGPLLERLSGRPRAIVIASAHSVAAVPTLLAAPRHAAVYDFGGFDRRLNALRYDVAGAPELAVTVEALMRGAGLPVQRSSTAGGLDHGIWTPLRYLFPGADVPVLPLAWPADWSPAQLLALGRALAPLREAGILMVGSGSITHNLRRVFAGGLRPDVAAPVTPESRAFRDWFADRVAAGDEAALLDYRARAPHAVLMHPSDEHLLPFYIAAGAGGLPGLRIHASHTHGDLGMDAYAFGAGAALLAEASSEAVAAPATAA